MQSMSKQSTPKPSVVPLPMSIGLFVLVLMLGSAGYVFRLMLGEPLMQVLLHMLKVLGGFLFGVPLLCYISSLVMNKFFYTNIHPRNALTLGLLLSTTAILSIMGMYS